MADSKCTARTNYVRVKDVDAAIKALGPFRVEVHRHRTEPDAIMVSNGENCTLRASYVNKDKDEVELDWAQWCRDNLKENQILVINEVSAESPLYIHSDACAYIHSDACAYSHEGDEVSVSLDEALEDAIRAKFGRVLYASPIYSEVI